MAEHSGNSGDTEKYVTGIAVIVASLIIAAAVIVGSGNVSSAVADAVGGLNKTLAEKQLSAGTGTGGTQQPVQPTQPTQPTQPQAPGKISLDISGKPYKGGADAKVTIVEISDFQCPFCGRAQSTVQQVLKDYGNKVKVVYMHYPLPFHQYAEKAAEASECAADQGKFWEMHDRIFANQDSCAPDDLKKHAADLGLDTAKFNSCLDSGEKAAKVKADVAQVDQKVASTLSGFGTPTFVINGKAIVGAQPYATFKAAIDAELG